MIPWSAFSPDLNPNDHVRNYLRRLILARDPKPQNRRRLNSDTARRIRQSSTTHNTANGIQYGAWDYVLQGSRLRSYPVLSRRPECGIDDCFCTGFLVFTICCTLVNVVGELIVYISFCIPITTDGTVSH